MSTLANSADPDEMPHICGISSGSALFARINTLFKNLVQIQK